MTKDNRTEIQKLADAVVEYSEAYGLWVSEEANKLWDLVEKHATRLPELFSEAKKEMK